MNMKIKINRNMITSWAAALFILNLRRKKQKKQKALLKFRPLVNKYKNKSFIVIVARDMNAPVGKKINETCIWKHSKIHNMTMVTISSVRIMNW